MRNVRIFLCCSGDVADEQHFARTFVEEELAKSAKGPWLLVRSRTWQGRAGRFQARGSTFLRKKVGITDPDLTLHSLRHRWRTLAREMGMPEMEPIAPAQQRRPI